MLSRFLWDSALSQCVKLLGGYIQCLEYHNLFDKSILIKCYNLIVATAYQFLPFFFLFRFQGDGSFHVPDWFQLETHDASCRNEEKDLVRARSPGTQPVPSCVRSQGDIQKISRQTNLFVYLERFKVAWLPLPPLWRAFSCIQYQKTKTKQTQVEDNSNL